MWKVCICVGTPSHVFSLVIPFPVLSSSSLLCVSHLAFHFCYCHILGPFCLRASGHRLSFVDTMSLIACRFVLRACFYRFSLLYPIDMPRKVGDIFLDPWFIADSHLIHHTIVKGRRKPVSLHSKRLLPLSVKQLPVC